MRLSQRRSKIGWCADEKILSRKSAVFWKALFGGRCLSAAKANNGKTCTIASSTFRVTSTPAALALSTKQMT